MLTKDFHDYMIRAIERRYGARPNLAWVTLLFYTVVVGDQTLIFRCGPRFDVENPDAIVKDDELKRQSANAMREISQFVLRSGF